MQKEEQKGTIITILKLKPKSDQKDQTSIYAKKYLKYYSLYTSQETQGQSG